MRDVNTEALLNMYTKKLEKLEHYYRAEKYRIGHEIMFFENKLRGKSSEITKYDSAYVTELENKIRRLTEEIIRKDIKNSKGK